MGREFSFEDYCEEVATGGTMFAWTRTFYAKKNGVYYNFDMKRQRDDAVKNHGMTKVPAVEAYGHFKEMVQVPWRMYERIMKEVNRC